jgi:phosphorylcholine metabolism protein LicD
MEIIDGLTVKQISDLNESEWQLFYSKNKNYIWKRDNFNFSQREEMLKDVKNQIDNGFEAYFANGILLGAYRNNDFIPWDDDIDFDVLAPNFYEKCEEVKQFFVDKGYIVYLNKQPGIAKLNVYKNLEKISFDVLFNMDEYYYFRMDCKWPKYLYKNHYDIMFKGINYKCPGPIEEYLVHVYGEDWTTPKNYPVKKDTLSKRMFIR